MAIFALIILICLSVFQILLAAGAPYGKYAWGGTHVVLPMKLRFSSVFSVFLYALFAYTILSKAGVVFESKPQWVDLWMWIFTAYFFVGIAMNGISRSKYERAIMTPVSVALALTFLVVAAS